MLGPGKLCSFRPEGIQDILDALQDVILVINTEMEVVSMNHAAVELFGLDPDALIGRGICSLFGEGSFPEDCLRGTIVTGESILDYQTTILMEGERRGEVLIRTVPLRRESGVIEAAAIILHDVTEVTSLRKEADRRTGYARMIGANREMQALYRLIEDVAPSHATVMIRGESGTGKELVARALHYGSNRADGPFVMVNCSALSENLLESELFGHVRGAFTGAVSTRKGRFEEAIGGTIFLDEIGDISPVVQVKLLRVLQQKIVEKVGDNTPVPVDVRVVSATNRDLEDLVARGLMREDFYYRIKVVSLQVPPLRDRREDIPMLLEHFLAGHGAEAREIDDAVLRILMSYDWPGNVRELEHAIEHAVVLARGERISPQHLPPEIVGRTPDVDLRLAGGDPDTEEARIRDALQRNAWRRGRTARELGIDRSTLWRKIKTYGISEDGGD